MSKTTAMVFSIAAMVGASAIAISVGHPEIAMGVSGGWMLAWAPLLYSRQP